MYRIALFCCALLAFSACGSDNSADAKGSDTTEQEASDTSLAPPKKVEADTVRHDADPPEETPDEPGGAWGFSPYVFERVGKDIITTIVEGPAGPQVRCQNVDLPCSFEDLKALEASGDPIPEEMKMTPEELTELVDQLSGLQEAIKKYSDVNEACADGYIRTTDEAANMGAHFNNGALVKDGVFDASKPEILMYQYSEDPVPPAAELGQCRNGKWQGGPMTLSGTSFFLPWEQVGNDHPEGFAGQLDNWHMHYQLCAGPNIEGGDRSLDFETCTAENGGILPKYGWMIHAWVAPDFDNQLGVFAMWNNTIRPEIDASEFQTERTFTPDDLPEGAVYQPINNFEFGDVTVAPGEEVFWSNNDPVPHTVSAGTADDPSDLFDSGTFGPGKTFETTFDTPGEYAYYCALHPQMKGVVTVK
ncbi:MAG: hypothetical protein KAZ88_02700 [Acidimicrobiia bacterium]|nr:hypothetical protein [Acidimicrobiia bacterium]MBP8179882.1 hypothetical protein [Acidimicrobiia bacterium]